MGLISVAALLGMANYLSLHYFKRFDFSSDPANRLSPQTLAILRVLTNETRATIFFDPARRRDVFSLTTRLLDEYQSVNPRLFTVRTLNYALFDGEAKEFLLQHHLNRLQDKDFVLFESGAQWRIVYGSELSDYNINEKFQDPGTELRRNAFKGEMLFSSALMSVTIARPVKAYFLQGHGEHTPEDTSPDNGYSKFADLLKIECNIQSASLLLRGTNAVPADCQLLIIAGPHRAAFSEPELIRIRDYLFQGGRLLVLLNNRAMGGPSGIEAVLSPWGVGVLDQAFEDKDAAASGHGQDLLVSLYSDGKSTPHPIINSLAVNGLSIKLFSPRIVYREKLDSKGADAPKVDWIAFSSTNSVGTNSLSNKLEIGSRPLVVAVEQGSVKGVTLDHANTRIVVIGDSLCFDNLNLDAVANHEFAHYTVNWLADRPPIMLKGLGPRALTEYRLLVTAAQFRRVCWLLLAGFPGSVLLIGGLVRLSRRR